ncbi:hypothetical protein FA13DRAFT_1874655 [Coprinellus micaceus]|uniref:Uncharacterized protein n=1 Tax=Coprinellus micaceus TaxID=71717 RepID=A0A4Y7S4J9_COPMI|nr:hypothetical protein FA13DRAFT_1874655 [Coprinellus micaceus]
MEYLNMNCSSEYNGRGAWNFRLAMRTHLQQTISIGYYLGTELLGGTDWPVPENPGNVRLCMTGLVRDPTCTVNYAQQFLTDGCYPPPPTVDSVSPNGTTSDDLIRANGASQGFGWVRVFGRFNLETCWPDTPDQCIKRNKNGTGWCYYPTGGFKSSYAKTNCSTADDGHGASDFRLAMRAHLQQTVSIGYYSGSNHTLLGGVDWPVPDNPGVVRLCMTGLGTDNIYRSTCVNAVSDNTLPSYAGWCSVNFGQQFVIDGCYPPPPTVDSISPNGTTPEDLLENGARGGGRGEVVDGSTVLARILPYIYLLSSVLFASSIDVFTVESMFPFDICLDIPGGRLYLDGVHD